MNGRPSMPAHARPNSHNDGWVCERGYRQQGSQCEELNIPPNALLDYSGHDWQCNRGYRKTVSGCEKVAFPENASLERRVLGEEGFEIEAVFDTLRASRKVRGRSRNVRQSLDVACERELGLKMDERARLSGVAVR